MNNLSLYKKLYPEPKEYTILESGTPHYIESGRNSGEYRNMYWKVYDENESKWLWTKLMDEVDG